ncbi:hemolysin family protein [Ornithinicoccus hortensis]|uniref:CBS domain containing-hemolysin-like protein n=1 Tax=Ornithinicoccus hortensis TaxID=82346 RepID=A0A542YVP6_9MICO|nr:hemolysin family protein [Ornithinicoccus hortensis]TQL52159.1 CBS domain containing-hemolysin-like protein [Ornithinicoccus hortensis]
MLIVGGLAVILLLTLLTGYFVAQEFAYVAVDRGKLRHLADQGDKAAARALDITSRLSFSLSGAQFGITVTVLLVGFVGEPLLGTGLAELLGFTGLSEAGRLSLSVTVTLLFSTFLQMVLGELGPKNWAIAEPVKLARALSRPTAIYLAVAGPVIALFDAASNKLLRSVGIEPVEELPQGATPEDLTRIIAESHTGGQIDADLSRILERGLAFRGHVAEEVMTPRIDVDTVQADEPASRVIELLGDGHSRFPVIGRDIDDIVGVVGLHELLEVPPAERSTVLVRELASDALIIPESLPLPRVLEELREQHRQLSIVVDEHGGFAGVITFEDVAEEVVGEIWDEGDEAEDPSVPHQDGSWQVPARLRLDEATEVTGVDLPEDEDYDTVSGLVMDRLGRTAEEGDTVEVVWQARDDHGDPEVHRVRIDVLTAARHVPETVAIHPAQITEGLLDDADEADDAELVAQAPDPEPQPEPVVRGSREPAPARQEHHVIGGMPWA